MLERVRIISEEGEMDIFLNLALVQQVYACPKEVYEDLKEKFEGHKVEDVSVAVAITGNAAKQFFCIEPVDSLVRRVNYAHEDWKKVPIPTGMTVFHKWEDPNARIDEYSTKITV